MAHNIKPGDTVRYFQPDVNGILAMWSGMPGEASGSIETATVTIITESAGVKYYATDEGVILTDSDLR